MNLMDIGQEIKERRLEKRLSLAELAKATNVNKATLSRYENGKIQSISLENFIAIAKVLEINLSDLNTTSDEKFWYQMDDQSKRIIETVGKLNDNRRSRVLLFVREQLATQKTRERFTTVWVDGVLSAGTGEFLDENSERFQELVPKPIPSNYDYAFKISGHSMEPFYQDDQVIFLQQKESYRSGQIVAAIVNGNAYLKRLQIKSDYLRLISLNKHFPDLTVTKSDDYRILGCVSL